MFGAELAAGFESHGVGVGEENSIAASRQDRDEEQAYGTAAVDDDRLRFGIESFERCNIAGLDAVQHTRQWFGEGGLLERERFWNAERVPLDETSRNSEELRKRAVEILQGVAEVFAVRPARLARTTGGGVGDDDAICPKDAKP